MNDIVYWDRFSKLLGIVFVIFMLSHLALRQHLGDPMPPLSSNLPGYLWAAVTSGLTATALFYFVFTRWLWRWSWLRPWLVKYPNLTGTWYAQFEGKTFATNFRSIVTIDHTFSGIRFTSSRRVSTTEGVACTLTRSQTNRICLFIIYRSKVVAPEDGIRASHGAQHEGCFYLELFNATEPKAQWRLRGDYWTNKPRGVTDSNDRGTWGYVTMTWQESRLASDADDDPSNSFLNGEAEEESRSIPKLPVPP